MSRSQRLIAGLACCLLAGILGPELALANETVHVGLGETADGQMAMVLSEPLVHPGKVTFQVSNNSKDIQHEFLVAKLKGMPEQVPYDATDGKVKEAALQGVHELGDLEPGKSGQMTVDLKAGKYLLFCNLPGHYRAGMRQVLTVKP
jgi:uncharacterized cupredoxin-like copper-binding protein